MFKWFWTIFSLGAPDFDQYSEISFFLSFLCVVILFCCFYSQFFIAAIILIYYLL